MTAPDGLVDLLVDLKRMGRGQRAWILGQLEDDHRAQVERLLDQSNRKPPKFDTLARLSPWLAEALADARRPDDQQGAKRLTAAARAALIDAERLLDTIEPQPAVPAPWFSRLLKAGRRG